MLREEVNSKPWPALVLERERTGRWRLGVCFRPAHFDCMVISECNSCFPNPQTETERDDLGYRAPRQLRSNNDMFCLWPTVSERDAERKREQREM